MTIGRAAEPAARPATPARSAVGRFALDRSLVLRPHVTALDAQSALAVDADEGAGAGDLGGIVNVTAARSKACELGLDFVEPPSDLFGNLVGVGMLFFSRSNSACTAPRAGLAPPR